MKKFFILAIAVFAMLSCSKGDNDPRLVIITFDGLRWQELFSGADASLAGSPKYVRDTPEEGREALMPFIWSYVPQHGYLIGNRDKESLMQVSNTLNFSYPGYSEMFCGLADDERVTSNDPIPNPNRSVLEAVAADPRYKGKTMMFSSWESIRFAVNNERGGFPGSSAHEPSYIDTYVSKIIQDMDAGTQNGGFGGGERMDFITYGLAMEALRQEHPKVFYIGFGDTDEFAHAGQYDNYLDAANWTDLFIRRIVEYCESEPYYKGKTTYILTTDHGRGKGSRYTSHGADIRPSRETWFIAFGAGVPALGETSKNGPFWTKQFSATIADILGVEFTPDNGEKNAPFDPTFYKEPEVPKAAASFEAVNATPKGKGLRYSYNEGDFMDVKDVLFAPVKTRGIVASLGTEKKEREDHFGFVFKGLMKIEKSGLYCLSLTSDDGSQLFLNGKLLLDLNRDGGGYKDIWLELAEGYHRLEIPYFENYGNESLEVGLEGPGISVSNLPESMLYYE